MKRVIILALVALPGVAFGDGEEMKCNAGDAAACGSHAGLLWQAGNKAEALRFYQRACDRQDLNSCYTLGSHLAFDEGVHDYKRAAQILGRACATVDGSSDCQTDCKTSCTSAFATCVEGCDAQKGDAYYECAAGCSPAQDACGAACPAKCAKAGTQKKDNSLAYGACGVLSSLYKDGKGVRKDPERAQRLHALFQTWQERMWAENDAWEAKNVHDNPKLYRDWEASCRRGEVDQCVNATALYVRTDPEVALELMTIMMRKKPESFGSLMVWADKMARLGKRDLVLNGIEEMCGDGIFSACYVIGMKYKTGDPWPKNLPRAIEFFTKGCSGGDRAACIALGNASDDPKLKARAAQLEKQWRAELKAQQAAPEAKARNAKWRDDAKRELVVQKQLEPYLARMIQLKEEAQAQQGERIAHDRLPPDELRAFDPAVTNEDIAAADAWRQRRAGRRREIVEWLDDLSDDLDNEARSATTH
jgi:TPR repeat protein